MTHASPRQPSTVPRRGRAIACCEWAYAAFVACAIITIHAGGDRWGWATLVAYGPRSLLLLPGVALLPLSLWRRRFWLTPIALVAALFGVLGLNIPWRSSLAGKPTSSSLRVLELNVNGADTDGKVCDPARLAALIADDSPDVMVMAEWTSADVPPMVGETPWNVRRVRDVLLATRFPILRTVTWTGRPDGEADVVGCQVDAGGRPLWCFGVQLETPRRGFEPVLQRLAGSMGTLAESVARRQRMSDAAAAFIRRTAGDADVAILGDFNAVDDGAIFRIAWSGWADAFTQVGWGFGWTKYQDHWGVRIDHVLTSGRLRPAECRIGPDVGSDHVPLLAHLQRGD